MTTCCSDDTLNIVYGKWNTCTVTGDIDIDSGKTVNLVGFVFTKVVCVNLLCFNYLTRNLIYGDTQAPTHMPTHSHSDSVRLSDAQSLRQLSLVTLHSSCPTTLTTDWVSPQRRGTSLGVPLSQSLDIAQSRQGVQHIFWVTRSWEWRPWQDWSLLLSVDHESLPTLTAEESTKIKSHLRKLLTRCASYTNWTSFFKRDWSDRKCYGGLSRANNLKTSDLVDSNSHLNGDEAGLKKFSFESSEAQSLSNFDRKSTAVKKVKLQIGQLKWRVTTNDSLEFLTKLDDQRWDLKASFLEQKLTRKIRQSLNKERGVEDMLGAQCASITFGVWLFRNISWF